MIDEKMIDTLYGGFDSRRDLILAAASDAGLDFISYNRKNDDELPPGEIEEAIDLGEITVEEIVAAFRDKLISCLEYEDE